MAIAVNNTSTGNIASGTTLTFSHTCGSTNQILWVGIESQNGDICTGVTYNGVAMTQAVKKTFVSINFTNYLYYLVGPASGANNISASFSSSTGGKIGYGVDYSGAKQTGQPDSTTSNAGTATSTHSISLTTVANNSWTIALVRQDAGGGTLTAGTGSTVRMTGSDAGVKLFDSNTDVTPAGSYTMNFNYGVSTGWNVVAASFSPIVSTNTSNFFNFF